MWYSPQADSNKICKRNLSLQEKATIIANNPEEFRKLREELRASGYVTSFALNQILVQSIENRLEKSGELENKRHGFIRQNGVKLQSQLHDSTNSKQPSKSTFLSTFFTRGNHANSESPKNTIDMNFSSTDGHLEKTQTRHSDFGYYGSQQTGGAFLSTFLKKRSTGSLLTLPKQVSDTQVVYSSSDRKNADLGFSSPLRRPTRTMSGDIFEKFRSVASKISEDLDGETIETIKRTSSSGRIRLRDHSAKSRPTQKKMYYVAA